MTHQVVFQSYGNGTVGVDDRGDFTCTVRGVEGASRDFVMACEIEMCQSLDWPDKGKPQGYIVVRGEIHAAGPYKHRSSALRRANQMNGAVRAFAFRVRPVY
jgi:hypothetical protein